MQYIFSLTIVCIICIQCVHCENGIHVLAVLPSVWKSHYLFGHHVLMQLIEQRNYTITIISPYNSNDINSYTNSTKHLYEIKVDGMLNNWLDMGMSFNLDEMHDKSALERFTRLMYASTSNIDALLSHHDVRQMLQNPKIRFDLLIIDLYLSDALLGLSYYYQVPTIVLSPSGSNIWLHQVFGNPLNAALDPSNFLPFTEHMNIGQRCLNTLMSIFEKLSYSFFHIISQQTIYEKHFESLCQLGGECYLPSHHNQLVDNLSLALINSHPVLQYPRAYLPNMINIAGVHLKRNLQLKLPRDFIEQAEDGVIYMSLGANALEIPLDKLQIFLEIFAASLSRFHFIIKYDSDKTAALINRLNRRNQFLISNWLPQQSILAHENVKLFITSCGLMSVIESIFFITPMLAIPILPEQYVLAERMQQQGVAKLYSYKNIITAHSDRLLIAIQDALNNGSYEIHLQNTRKLLLSDLNGNKPLERSINAIDLVLDTKGIAFLKTHGHLLNFWRTALIDVLSILILGFIAILAGPYLITSCILRRSYQNHFNFQNVHCLNNYKNNVSLPSEKLNAKQLQSKAGIALSVSSRPLAQKDNCKQSDNTNHSLGSQRRIGNSNYNMQQIRQRYSSTFVEKTANCRCSLNLNTFSRKEGRERAATIQTARLETLPKIVVTDAAADDWTEIDKINLTQATEFTSSSLSSRRSLPTATVM